MVLRVISYPSSYLNLKTNLCVTNEIENIIGIIRLLGIGISKYGKRIFKVICPQL